MTFSELCISSGGKLLTLSWCAPKIARGRLNFRCKVTSAPLDMTHLKLNFAIVVFTLPVTKIFTYVNFVPSVRIAEPTVDLN